MVCRPRHSSGEVDKMVSTGFRMRPQRRSGSTEEASYRQDWLTAASPMTVLFGPLGWRPQSLLPSVRSTEDLEGVVFYHGDHAKSRDGRSKVMEFCRALVATANAREVR